MRSPGYKDPKDNVPGCQTCKYANTNTNTALVEVAHRPNICYIFGMVMLQGPQRQCSQVSDMQIHKYEYKWYEDLENNDLGCVIITVEGLNLALKFKCQQRLCMCYIFGKPWVQGSQRQWSQVSDIQIDEYRDKYKYAFFW